MSELAQELARKAREWKAEAERAPERWRPMCEMLAREYERVAREQMSATSEVPEKAEG